MRMCCIVALVFASAAPALAQAPAPQPTKLIISNRVMAVGLEKVAPPAAQSRDSLKNGAVIGAVIGAVALAAPGAWICHMLREPSDPPCWKSVVRVGAIGAGVGVVAGAGVDAMLMRDARRFPPLR